MQPVIDMQMNATLTLSEPEVRVLEHLASYEDGLTKMIREHVTKNFEARVLTALLKRMRSECGACVAKFDKVREAYRAP